MELDCALTPAPEMVVLRELEAQGVSAGGFFLAENTLGNSRTGFYKVEAVGSIAEKETKLAPGDFVYADRLASYYHTSPVCVMKWNNVLLKTDSTKTELHAMPGWALMTEKEQPKTGFIVQDNKEIKKGIITDISPLSDDCPFKVGDEVMITAKCDVFDGFSVGRLFAMKVEEIVARFD